MAKGSEEVLDSPTEFLADSLVQFDASLRCQICREHYRAPIITKCSHTFCSICIGEIQHRRCPTCLVELNEGANRKDAQLEEIVLLWQNARATLLSLESSHQASLVASTSKTPTSHHRSASSSSTSNSRHRHSNPSSGHASSADEAPPRTRSRVARQDLGKGKGKGKMRVKGSTKGEDDSSDIEIIEVAASAKSSGNGKGKSRSLEDPEMDVTCPNCSRTFKNKVLYSHTTKCLSGGDVTSSKPSGPLHGLFGTNGFTSAPTKTTTRSSKAALALDKPLPPTNYAGLTSAKLANLLKELGLPTTIRDPNDDKLATYTRRHERWVLLWNSNCNFKPENPLKKTKQALLKDLDKWEETQRFRAPVINPEQHLAKHASDFNKMIAAMKTREAQKKIASPLPLSDTLPVNLVPEPTTIAPSEGEEADIDEMDVRNEMEELAAEAAAAQISQQSRDSSPPLVSSRESSMELPMLPPPRPSALAQRKREREPSPFDENGPRPSQRIRPVEKEEEEDGEEEITE